MIDNNPIDDLEREDPIENERGEETRKSNKGRDRETTSTITDEQRERMQKQKRLGIFIAVGAFGFLIFGLIFMFVLPNPFVSKKKPQRAPSSLMDLNKPPVSAPQQPVTQLPPVGGPVQQQPIQQPTQMQPQPQPMQSPQQPIQQPVPAHQVQPQPQQQVVQQQPIQQQQQQKVREQKEKEALEDIENIDIDKDKDKKEKKERKKVVTTTTTEKIHVNAVACDGKCYAVINGKIYTEGSRVGNRTIVKITTDGVIFDK